MNRVAVHTWNVAGKPPSPDLNLKDWIDTSTPADIYVFGLEYLSGYSFWRKQTSKYTLDVGVFALAVADCVDIVLFVVCGAGSRRLCL